MYVRWNLGLSFGYWGVIKEKDSEGIGEILQKFHVSAVFIEKLIFANFHVLFSMHPNFQGRDDFMMSQWRHMKFNGTHFGING